MRPALILPAAEWMQDLVPWLVLAALAVLAASLAVQFLLLARLKALEENARKLARLEELKASLDRLLESHGGLDLRRLEHVLIDIRDGQRRVEDRLLSVLESSRRPEASTALSEPHGRGAAGALSDRIVTRMLALGYDRIQLVTAIDDLAKFVDGDGEVLLEARRDGAPCKGKVSVRNGLLADVQMQAAYSTFP